MTEAVQNWFGLLTNQGVGPFSHTGNTPNTGSFLSILLSVQLGGVLSRPSPAEPSIQVSSPSSNPVVIPKILGAPGAMRVLPDVVQLPLVGQHSVPEAENMNDGFAPMTTHPQVERGEIALLLPVSEKNHAVQTLIQMVRDAVQANLADSKEFPMPPEMANRANSTSVQVTLPAKQILPVLKELGLPIKVNDGILQSHNEKLDDFYGRPDMPLVFIEMTNFCLSPVAPQEPVQTEADALVPIQDADVSEINLLLKVPLALLEEGVPGSIDSEVFPDQELQVRQGDRTRATANEAGSVVSRSLHLAVATESVTPKGEESTESTGRHPVPNHPSTESAVWLDGQTSADQLEGLTLERRDISSVQFPADLLDIETEKDSLHPQREGLIRQGTGTFLSAEEPQPAQEKGVGQTVSPSTGVAEATEPVPLDSADKRFIRVQLVSGLEWRGDADKWQRINTARGGEHPTAASSGSGSEAERLPLDSEGKIDLPAVDRSRLKREFIQAIESLADNEFHSARFRLPVGDHKTSIQIQKENGQSGNQFVVKDVPIEMVPLLNEIAGEVRREKPDFPGIIFSEQEKLDAGGAPAELTNEQENRPSKPKTEPGTAGKQNDGTVSASLRKSEVELKPSATAPVANERPDVLTGGEMGRRQVRHEQLQLDVHRHQVEDRSLFARIENVQQIAEKLVQTAKLEIRGGRSEIRLQLKPEHLGFVRIIVSQQTDELTGRIVVDRADVKHALEAQLPVLHRSLQEQQIRFDRLEIIQTTAFQTTADSAHDPGRGFDAQARQNRLLSSTNQDGRMVRQSAGTVPRTSGKRRFGYNSIEITA